MVSRSLLIVWVYYPAVGHLVEALSVAANYYSANTNLKIHILVHHKTPYKIGNYCHFIESMHALDISDYQNDIDKLQNIPQEGFDYVIFPKGFKEAPQYFPEPFLSCNKYLQCYFKAKIWSGYNDILDEHPSNLRYSPYSPFKIDVPHDRVTINLPDSQGYPLIAVMLKGASKQNVWPTKKTWRLIFKRIKKEYPEVRFLITGISSAHTTLNKDNKNVKNQIDKFINSIPGAINYYDIGLENQLAVIQKADVFISPHTGFAFLAPCLDTPWLTLSGGEWEEDMLAKQPFYSILPNCNKYPCHSGDMKMECKLRLKLKQPIRCMSNLLNKQDDILKGLKKLLDSKYTFQDAFHDYEELAIKNGVNKEKLWRLSDFKSKLK